MNDVRLIDMIRQVGPFEDWSARPAASLGLPIELLARRVSPDRADASELCERLRYASSISDAVAHQNILTAVGMWDAVDGTAIQLSDLPDASDLEQCFDTVRALPVASVVWIARQVLEGLCHAHGLNKVHGNLSPSAIWLDRVGTVRVDFGLCAYKQFDLDMVTMALDLRFAHPNWIDDGEPRPAFDVYAVAALLWWLLSGRPCRNGPVSPPESSLRKYRSDVPAELEDLLLSLTHAEHDTISASELQEHLNLIFFRTLEARDQEDGRVPVQNAVDLHQSTSDAMITAELQVPEISVEGMFSRAIAAVIEEPILPRSMSISDGSPSHSSRPLEDDPTVQALQKPMLGAQLSPSSFDEKHRFHPMVSEIESGPLSDPATSAAIPALESQSGSAPDAFTTPIEPSMPPTPPPDASFSGDATILPPRRPPPTPEPSFRLSPASPPPNSFSHEASSNIEASTLPGAIRLAAAVSFLLGFVSTLLLLRSLS